MKIAVPSKENAVDDHFGHCEYFTVFTVENGKIANEQRVDSPAGCGCKSNISTELAHLGVTILLAGNMGQGAVNKLGAAGISVVRGCSGNIRTLVESYIAGTISDSGTGCAGHGDNHVCTH